MSELSNNLINGQTRSKYIEVTHRESQNRLLIIKQCFGTAVSFRNKIRSRSRKSKSIFYNY